MSYAPIREKLAHGKTVILDGAIGTEILRRNVTWADHQLVNKPEFVRGIHADYMRAGAEIISTNSFQLCRRALYNHFRDDAHRQHIGARDLETRAEKLLAASVKLAVEARDVVKPKQPCAIAAAVTTLEWCFRPDLAPADTKARTEYREIFQTVKDAGADLVLLETVNSIGSKELATKAPEVAKFLKNFQWASKDEIGEVMLAIQEGAKPEAAAKDWVAKHPERVADWIK